MSETEGAVRSARAVPDCVWRGLLHFVGAYPCGRPNPRGPGKYGQVQDFPLQNTDEITWAKCGQVQDLPLYNAQPDEFSDSGRATLLSRQFSRTKSTEFTILTLWGFVSRSPRRKNDLPAYGIPINATVKFISLFPGHTSMFAYQDPKPAEVGDPPSQIDSNNPLGDSSHGNMNPWLLARSELISSDPATQ